MNGQGFRHYHLLLEEDAERIFWSRDDIAELAHNIGGTAFWFPSDLSEHQHLNNRMKGSVAPNDDVNW
jgi:starvation-inducible DNA-binding protein